MLGQPRNVGGGGTLRRGLTKQGSEQMETAAPCQRRMVGQNQMSAEKTPNPGMKGKRNQIESRSVHNGKRRRSRGVIRNGLMQNSLQFLLGVKQQKADRRKTDQCYAPYEPKEGCRDWEVSTKAGTSRYNKKVIESVSVKVQRADTIGRGTDKVQKGQGKHRGGAGGTICPGING